ncbi:MAG: hypothetical protein QW613_05460, partial [Thermoprotei archaeon]
APREDQRPSPPIPKGINEHQPTNHQPNKRPSGVGCEHGSKQALQKPRHAAHPQMGRKTGKRAVNSPATPSQQCPISY